MLFGTWLILALLIAVWLMVVSWEDRPIQRDGEWKLFIVCALLTGAIMSGMFVGVYWFATTFKPLFGCMVFGVLIIMLIKKASNSKSKK